MRSPHSRRVVLPPRRVQSNATYTCGAIMKKAWLYFAVATAVVTILGAAWYNHTCTLPRSMALKASWIAEFHSTLVENKYPQSLGCAELWIYRYQGVIGSLVGSLLAIFAALVAGGFALKAAEPMQHQTKIARAQAATSLAPLLYDQIQSLSEENFTVDRLKFFLLELIRLKDHMRTTDPNLNSFGRWRTQAEDLSKQIAGTLATYIQISNKYPRLELESVRHALATSMQDAHDLCKSRFDAASRELAKTGGGVMKPTFFAELSSFQSELDNSAQVWIENIETAKDSILRARQIYMEILRRSHEDIDLLSAQPPRPG